MDYEQMDQEITKLASKVRKAVGEFLDTTEHQALPAVEVEFQDCSVIGNPEYVPIVRVKVIMEAQV